MLTSEFFLLENQLLDEEPVVGVFLLNSHVLVYGAGSWCRFDMRGNLQEKGTSPEDPGQRPLLLLDMTSLDNYRQVFWSGSLDDPAMRLRTKLPALELEPLDFHRYTRAPLFVLWLQITEGNVFVLDQDRVSLSA